MYMNILAISDTHNKHYQLKIPSCDLLIHAGDFTGNGDIFEIKDFLSWWHTQPARHKVFIAGNHELTLCRYTGRYREYNHQVVKQIRNLRTYTRMRWIIR